MLIDGWGGRYSLLSCVSWGHSSKKCWTVSYGAGQCRHSGRWHALILFRCLFNFECPVLIWKMVHWFALVSLLMLSLMLGLHISLYIARPVDPAAHRFNHSSLQLFRRILLVVCISTGISGCSMPDPCFASTSAFSLP